MPVMSLQCRECFGMELELRVLRNPAGRYYIGTLDEDGRPFTRDSVEYWRSREEASAALESGSFTIRTHP